MGRQEQLQINYAPSRCEKKNPPPYQRLLRRGVKFLTPAPPMNDVGHCLPTMYQNKEVIGIELNDELVARYNAEDCYEAELTQ